MPKVISQSISFQLYNKLKILLAIGIHQVKLDPAFQQGCFRMSKVETVDLQTVLNLLFYHAYGENELS